MQKLTNYKNIHRPKTAQKSLIVDKYTNSTAKNEKLWIKNPDFAQVVPKRRKNT